MSETVVTPVDTPTRPVSNWPGFIALLASGFGVGWLIGLSFSPVVQIVVASMLGLVASIVAALCGTEIQCSASNKADETATADANTASVRPSHPVYKANPIPLGFLLTGVVLGSAFGIWVRENDLLGVDPQRVITKWRQPIDAHPSTSNPQNPGDLRSKSSPPADTYLTDAEMRTWLFKFYYQGQEPRAEVSPTPAKASAASKKHATGPANDLTSASQRRGAGLYLERVRLRQILQGLEGAELRNALATQKDARIQILLRNCTVPTDFQALRDLLCAQ